MQITTYKQSTLGIIKGNRDFFPDKLVAEARTEILEVFKKLNITPICFMNRSAEQILNIVASHTCTFRSILSKQYLSIITHYSFVQAFR